MTSLPDSPVLARAAPLPRLEQDVIRLVAQALPEVGPYAVWGGLEVFAPSGAIFEVDLVALGHHALYVVETKQWGGRVTGDTHSWQIAPPGGVPRRVESPLLLAAHQAHLIAAALRREDPVLARLRVEPLVLLTGEGDVDLRLPAEVRQRVIRPGDLAVVLQRGELPGAPAAIATEPVDEATAAAVHRALDGLQRRRRPGHGSFLEEAALLQRTLVADLRAAAQQPEIHSRLVTRHARQQTAAPLAEWMHLRIEEVAAAWIISCTFLRTLEDQNLLDAPWLAGEDAKEKERRFWALSPRLSTRDYLIAALRDVARTPAGDAVLGPAHNPIWEILPTQYGARVLLEFFRQHERGALRWTFSAGTRAWWTDLYQDLCPELRRQHALLATPTFVCRFLLDLTLAPALSELGADTVRLLDPACGSGQLLVEAFERLLERAQRTSSGAPPMASALAALDRVHGLDITAVAVLVTRIRLALALLEKAGVKRLAEAPELPLHVARADSLLGAPGVQNPEAAAILGRRYEVVIDNPPFITCKDEALREEYRHRYASASGKFTLTAPFIERYFQLAADAGFVGVLTANSFMKREFGRTLVEQVLPKVELTRVIDTSGAFIPGHGTPTVILVARNQPPRLATIRVVRARRGEPITPAEPEKARVWSSIVAHFDDVGYEDDVIDVVDLPRTLFAKHPWSIAGGAAAELKELLEQRSRSRLGEIVSTIGLGARTGLDDVFELPIDMAARLGLEAHVLRPVVRGESIRDWGAVPTQIALAPYGRDTGEPLRLDPKARWAQFLWSYRSCLQATTDMRGPSRGPFWTWLRWQNRSDTGLRMVMAAIARSTHLALLPAEAEAVATVSVIDPAGRLTEDELFALLGYLNSSTACFWMKQTSSTRGVLGSARRAEDIIFEFGGRIRHLPIPGTILEPGPFRDEIAALARRLHEAARERACHTPAQVLARWDRASRRSLLLALAEAQQRDLRILRQMVCDQEDLDWSVYSCLGLAPADLRRSPGSALPEQRPYLWLSEEAPASLHPRLAELWTLRRKALLSDWALRLLESTIYKRAFELESAPAPYPAGGIEEDDEERPSLPLVARRTGRAEDFRRRTVQACEAWLLDRVEDLLRTQGAARCLSAPALAGLVAALPGALAVASVLAGREDSYFSALLAALLDAQAVPYLAALRYTEAGLQKRAAWEQTWEAQRREDAGEPVQPPVPPRYEVRDYRSAVAWRLRGKLDVPRERFIVYPHASADGATPLYGWAGWDDAQRAEALLVLYEQSGTERWEAPRRAPLLAGLLELVPRLARGGATEGHEGTSLEQRVAQEARALGLTIEQIRAYRPDVTVALHKGKGRTTKRRRGAR